MIITKVNIEGLLIFEPRVFEDERGYFFESYNKKVFTEHVGDVSFFQDNISKSMKGTVRGLHYQVGEFAQGKLCQVLLGSVLDVALDIRFGSPTFGEYFEVELSSKNHKQLWIPSGFAHGFSVLSEEAIFMYKCTNLYSKAHERAILYNDPQLGIDWKVDNPIVSEKDLDAKMFKEIEKE
ncbi:MAG: dTDP-4-dehydrorhamnose 3,5-epimerase [Ignavibacteriaceae bacterium]|nr:dTDP-4-dehydrorhamnose 3,5-epimerase [Ignavibacteriaceae bacterium]